MESVKWLSKLGVGGARRSNIERDFHRAAKREFRIGIDPYYVKVPMKQTDGSIKNEEVAVLLPHELFAELANRHADHFVNKMQGRPGLVSKFWLAHRSERWMQDHPLRREVEEHPENFIPLRLWGDDSGINKKQTRGIRVLSWSSATCSLPSLQSKMAIYYLQVQKMLPATEHELHKVVAWSMNCLIMGFHPTTDHQMKPLRGARKTHAGKPLVETNEAMRGIFCQAAGDWKYLKEVWKLPQSWNKPLVCHECLAEHDGDLNYADASPTAPWVGTERTTVEYLQSLADTGLDFPPLIAIIGWCKSMIVDDGLHDDMLGVRMEVVGGCLLTLVEKGYFGLPDMAGGSWKDRLDTQLLKAYKHWRAWLRMSGNTSSHSQFRCTQLGLSCKDDWVLMKGKAHDFGVLSVWLADCTRDHVRMGVDINGRALPDPIGPMDHVLATTMSGFRSLWWLYHEGAVLTQPERIELEESRKIALQGFNTLSSNARATGQWKYKMRPKFHKLDHALRRSARTGWNLSMLWSFGEEDWLGQQCQMTSNCHGSSLHRRAPQRWLAFYFNELKSQ